MNIIEAPFVHNYNPENIESSFQLVSIPVGEL